MIFDNKCQIRSKMLLNLSFEQFLTYTFRYSHGSTYLSPELTCRHQWSKLLKIQSHRTKVERVGARYSCCWSARGL